ncbi:MAG: hypothetical protein RI973_1664 [Bacteroidota bacterium]|jgi:tetratricopeptide (TPR) repeat protein
MTKQKQLSTPFNTQRYGWVLFAIGVLLYSNTLFFDYTLDDAIVIYDNEFTTKGVAGIPGLLKYDTFRGFFKVEGKEKLVAGGRYRPLTPAMYALEVQLFAPEKKDAQGQAMKDKDGNAIFDPNEAGQHNAVKLAGHLVNVLLYSLSLMVLFYLLLSLLKTAAPARQDAQYPVLVAFSAALIFAVHPIHTEAVANVKGRDEIMSLLGSLAALYCSLRAMQDKKPLLGLAAGGLFFLALLSKENAITFLAIVPLTFYFFTSARPGKIAVQTAPYLVAATLFLLIRGSILGWEGAGEAPRELMNNPFLKLVGNQYVDFTPGEKLATVFYTLGKYVQLLFFPHPLSHDYYPRAVDIMQLGDWQVILSVLLYLGMGIFALVRLPKKDILSYCILFYLASLSVVSNLVFPVGTNMSERFIYMPSVGFALLVALLFQRLAGKRKVVMAMGALVLLVLGIMTFSRNFAWQDNYTLFTTDVKTVPNSAKLRNACGGELIAQSLKPENEARKTAMLAEAVDHLKAAISIHPTYKNPYLLLGNAYNYLKEYETSIQAYRQALQLDDNYGEARNNLAITLRDAGRFYGEQKGDLSKSLSYLTQSYDINPADYETARLLGVAHGISGNATQAVAFFGKAQELAPGNADALYNLGTAYFNAGQPALARRYVEEAKKINPNIEAERKGGQ